MKQTIGFPKPRRYIRIQCHPVKLTALLYLKEALIAENYEICRDFIGIAREFGASAAEVQAILEDSRRVPSG